MISSGLATVPRGACLAGVAVVCGGLYLAWSYWSNSGNDTSQNAESEVDGGANEKNQKISNSAENLNLSKKPLGDKIGLLEQSLNKIDDVKLKSKEKMKQKSVREELLLKNAIEFTKTQIATTETLAKQLLVSEKHRLDVKFSSKRESISHILSDNSKKGDSPGIKLRKNNNLFQEDIRDWEDCQDCVKPQGHGEWNLKVDDNRNINFGDTKLKPSNTSHNTVADSKMNSFSQKKLIANSSVKDGTRAENINYGSNISANKSARPASKQDILKNKDIAEKSIKLEVENVLNEILAVVDDGNKANNDSATKGDRLPTDKEFVSFLYVNQAYFTSQASTG